MSQAASLMWTPLLLYFKLMTTTIFTDGAARSNPGPGGWGAILIKDGGVTELGGREDNTTNNRMELMAVISALQEVSDGEEITIYADSAYVLNGITRWVKGWQKNNWRTSKKEDVINRDLWEKLVKLTDFKIIDWKLIKGHSGTAANERCDEIATSFADKNPTTLYKGKLSDYKVSISVDQIQNSKSKKSKTTKKPYSYVSVVNGRIETHKTWEECKVRVHGVSGAKYKKVFSEEEEAQTIKEYSK